VINAIWDSEVSIGDKVLIVGFGIIGTLLSEVLTHIPGVDIDILEIEPIRVKKGKELNFHIFSNQNDLNGDYSHAFNTSTSEKGIQIALDQVRFEGKVVELSWYGSRNVNLNLGGDFHHGRKRIISSQVSQIPTRKKDRFDLWSRKQLAFRIMDEINLNKVINRKIPFSMAPEFYHQLKNENVKDIGILFAYK
jgi:threonine dehydrogenase-like Zn-dependent dehydrogenase